MGQADSHHTQVQPAPVRGAAVAQAPQWAPPKDVPLGLYVVTYKDGLPVNSGQLRTSPIVGNTALGQRVHVLEILPKDIEGRFRARIERPPGWISIATTMGEYFAVPLSPPVVVQVNLEGSWVNYGAQEQALILGARAERKPKVCFRANGQNYEIDFGSLRQTNTRSGKTREIRIVPEASASPPGGSASSAAPVTVTATPVQAAAMAGGAEGAGGAGTGVSYGAPAPKRPLVEAPAKPSDTQLEELISKDSDSRLNYMQANPQLVSDWLYELPQVKGLMDRQKTEREMNCVLARTLMEEETKLSSLTSELERAKTSVGARRKAVEALLARRDDVLRRRSADALAAELEVRAKASDAEGERCHHEALEAATPLDAAALAAFRQRYVQHKVEKHRRLAAKERLLRPQEGGA